MQDNLEHSELSNITHYCDAVLHGNLQKVQDLFDNLNYQLILSLCQTKTDDKDTLLHLAALNAHDGLEILTYLTAKLGINANDLLKESNNIGATVYHIAVRCGSASTVKFLLDNFSNDELKLICQMRRHDGVNLLQLAVCNEEFGVTIVTYLKLRLGDFFSTLLTQRDVDGFNTYHVTASQANGNVFELITKDDDKQSMILICQSIAQNSNTLHYAVENTHYAPNIIQYIKAKLGRDIYPLLKQNHGDGYTVYHHAAHYGNIDTFKLIIDDLESEYFIELCQLESSDGQTIFHFASKNAHGGSQILEYLKLKLDQKVYMLFKREDHSGLNAYHCAAKCGDEKILGTLMKDLDVQNVSSICQLKTINGFTLLHLAIHNQSSAVEILNYLRLRLGELLLPRLAQSSKNGWTVYHHAALDGDKIIFESLFNHMTKHDIFLCCELRTNAGDTLLHLVASNKAYGAEFLAILQSKLPAHWKALSEQLNNEGKSVYQVAALCTNKPVLELLLNDASVDTILTLFQSRVAENTTILDLLAYNNADGDAVLQYLQQKLARNAYLLFDKQNGIGWTIYHFVAVFGNATTLDVLLSNKDISTIQSICQLKTTEGATLLHGAICNKLHALEMINYLRLKLGHHIQAILSQANSDGWTVYHEAAIGSDKTIVELLFKDLTSQEVELICEVKISKGLDFMGLAKLNVTAGTEIIDYVNTLLPDPYDKAYRYTESSFCVTF